jgi:hypothetical protein
MRCSLNPCCERNSIKINDSMARTFGTVTLDVGMNAQLLRRGKCACKFAFDQVNECPLDTLLDTLLDAFREALLDALLNALLNALLDTLLDTPLFDGVGVAEIDHGFLCRWVMQT